MPRPQSNTARTLTQKLQLYIDGGSHIGRSSPRIDKIEEAVGSVDVVFVEAPGSEDPSYARIILNFMSVPTMLAVIYIWISILEISSIFGISDGKIIDTLESEHGAERVDTDRGLHSLIAESRKIWAVGHTLMILIAFLSIPTFVAEVVTRPLFGGISIFALAGLTLFATFLAGTLPSRDSRMARDIERYARETDATSACLVTGKQHVAGITRILEQSECVILVD